MPGTPVPARPAAPAGGRDYFVGRVCLYMVNVLATVAAVFAVVLFGFGLLSMNGGSFTTAGASFLSASLLIYMRETYLVDG